MSGNSKSKYGMKKRPRRSRRKRLLRYLLSTVMVVAMSFAAVEFLPSMTKYAAGDSTYGSQLMVGRERASAALKTSFDESSLLSLTYTGKSYEVVSGGTPAFAEEAYVPEAFEYVSSFDVYGRCGTAVMVAGPETLATKERGSIGMVKPSGWHTVRYANVEGKYLYNRCHLLMYALSGILDDPHNLITGTRYLNIEGMLPFEEQMTNYVRRTGHHVLYRVTPIYHGNDLVARGVHMEASSVEDHGASLSFNVYCFNVQPGIAIDYATGDSHAEDGTPSWSAQGGYPSSSSGSSETRSTASGSTTGNAQAVPAETTYVLNTSSKRFHRPDCSSVRQMAEHNTAYSTLTRDELIAQGYVSCGNCHP